MNTLPVATWQNIAAKATVAVFYQIISLIVAVVAGCLFAMVVSRIDAGNFFAAFGNALYELYSIVGGVLWLYALEICILMLISLFGANMMLYAAMSIGHTANSHKVVSSVAVFLGFYIISQIINSVLLRGAIQLYSLDGIYSISEYYRAQPIILITIVIEIFYLAAYFLITKYFLKHRLNLQ